MLSKVEARGIWIIPQWQSIKDLRVKTALPGRYLATILFLDRKLGVPCLIPILAPVRTLQYGPLSSFQPSCAHAHLIQTSSLFANEVACLLLTLRPYDCCCQDSKQQPDTKKGIINREVCKHRS